MGVTAVPSAADSGFPSATRVTAVQNIEWCWPACGPAISIPWASKDRVSPPAPSNDLGPLPARDTRSKYKAGASGTGRDIGLDTPTGWFPASHSLI
jgi:hypothetical protein